MCGVAASLDKSAREHVRFVSHRGIRDSCLGQIGHARLPIVSLGPEGDQPIQSRNWTLAFVGEFLEFRELRYRTELDLLADRWSKGPRAFSDLDGFWSVVAHDSTDDSLHLLVDYLAQKPLYYRVDQPAAASEPDAAAAYGTISLDEVYLSAVQKWGYCPDVARTPYNEIKRTLPGEYVVLRRNRPPVREIVNRLWPEAWNIKEELDAAVRRRVLSSDVPVACLVSGGLDSSVVAHLARQYSSSIRYYQVDTGLTSPVDGATTVAAADIGLDTALDWMQEPLDLGSLLPQCSLATAVEERVCLTGDGADEAFGGYGRAARYDSQASDMFQELPCWHLPRLDRIHMRHKTEIRSPFLARRVLEYALSLPWERRTNKQVLRELFPQFDVPKVPMKRLDIDRVDIVKRFRERYRRKIEWP